MSPHSSPQGNHERFPARELPPDRDIPPRDIHFDQAMGMRSHNEMMAIALRRADELIAAHHQRGLTPTEEAELPQVANALRQVLNTQLGARVRGVDLTNGAYENAPVDNLIRIRITQIRDLNIDLTRSWLTRMPRKIIGWFNEDIFNWFRVKPREYWDNTKHFLYNAGMVAAGATAVIAGGYMLAGAIGGEGAFAGLGTLGRHAGVAWNTVTGRGGAPAPEVEPPVA